MGVGGLMGVDGCSVCEWGVVMNWLFLFRKGPCYVQNHLFFSLQKAEFCKLFEQG